MDYRLSSSNGVGKADSKLENGMLFYFQNFRRVYMFMWEQVSWIYWIVDRIVRGCCCLGEQSDDAYIANVIDPHQDHAAFDTRSFGRLVAFFF